MKIFLDTADIDAIKKYARMGVVDGVTTNPTHLAKAGVDPRARVQEIAKLLPGGDISVEVTEKDPELVYLQAQKIAGLADNVVVKVPCHKEYYEVIHRLVKDGIELNITLVFTLLQGIMMSKLGVKYISPFVGRWDDIDVDGISLLSELRFMADTYDFKTGVLAASIRTVRNFHDAVMAGADVVTLPINVFEKSLDHPLTNHGIEKFDADWQKLGVKQFP